LIWDELKNYEMFRKGNVQYRCLILKAYEKNVKTKHLALAGKELWFQSYLQAACWQVCLGTE
jgi:hypothetical protein